MRSIQCGIWSLFSVSVVKRFFFCVSFGYIADLSIVFLGFLEHVLRSLWHC